MGVNHIEDMEQKYSNFKEYEGKVYYLDSSRIRKVLKIILSLKKGTTKEKLLEIGCLSGRNLSFLKRNGYECYGIDLIDRPKNLDKDIIFIKHNVEEKLPFKNNLFDIVYAGEVIEHLYDTDNFIKEIYRILKPNGYVIITTPNMASLINRFLLSIGKLPRYVEYRKGGVGHIHFYTLRTIEGQLCSNGLKVEIKIGNFLSLPDPTNGKKIRNSILSFLGDFFPTLSENIIIVAKKKI